MKNEAIAVPARLTVDTGGETRSADLYSAEGLALAAELWLKLSVEHRRMYQVSWLGVPVIQLPEDVLMMQELIWKLRPDLIIECGFAHGGSAILYASVCELAGHGEVLSIDVDIRQPNRVAVQSHPMSSRIHLWQGSSLDAGTYEHAARLARNAGKVLVVLDSNHSRDHVRQEIDLYHRLVTPGSYLVVMDGAQSQVWDIPRGRPEWREDHPLAAIEEFLALNPGFVCDPHYNRLHITSSPRGFLRRWRPGEVPA